MNFPAEITRAFGAIQESICTACAPFDPDAILEVANDEVEVRFSINELKAEALLLEGTTHQLYDINRAIPALVAEKGVSWHCLCVERPSRGRAAAAERGRLISLHQVYQQRASTCC